MKLVLRGGTLAVIALVITAAATAGDARANPSLSMSYAKQQMTKFAATHIAQPMERKGMTANVKIDSCWRVSSWRVNCHVRLETHDRNPYSGSDDVGFCSGTWTAYNQSSWFRIKNVSWACS
jgi:hypothetical protein